MSYIVSSSEKTRSTASEFETKALLYLMNFCDNHQDCQFFVIDVFNDVSAHSTHFDKSWDLQSKACKTASAKEIGRELVTLLKNFLSDFTFDYSILFIGGVPDSFRIDCSKTTFGIDNVNKSAIKSLKSGIIAEAKEKGYIDETTVTDDIVSTFLQQVTFVIDDKTNIEYILSCIDSGKRIIPSTSKLERIFSSIRDAQSTCKDRRSIEGKAISSIEQSLLLNRHITRDSIRLKILSDLIGDSFAKNNIPNNFIDVLNEYGLNTYEREDIADDCYFNLCKVYFDINNEHNFWKLFSHIYKLIQSNKSKTVNEIYGLSDKNLFKKVRNLDPNTAKYFIALIMEVSL